jgi:hypothetical protein
MSIGDIHQSDVVFIGGNDLAEFAPKRKKFLGSDTSTGPGAIARFSVT